MRSPERVRRGPENRGLNSGVWAAIVGVATLGYFFLSISLSTSFFIANGGPVLEHSTVWLTTAILVVQAVLVLLRKRPILMFALVVACYIAVLVVFPDRTMVAGATLLFAVYNLVLRRSTLTWGTLIAAIALVDVILQFERLSAGGRPPTAFVIVVVVVRTVGTYVPPILAGLLVRSHERRLQLAAERERLARDYGEAVQREQNAQLAAAVTAERTRMARELHDVAAHHLAGVLLQSKAALRVMGSDPATASELLSSIAHEGDLTMQSLREVVGVLRATDEEETTGPTMTQLPDLIDSLRATHPHLEFTLVGAVEDLTAATSLACYRIVQESLSNARKHAPGSIVTVRVERHADQVTVDVRNSAGSAASAAVTLPSSGFGLVGMRERATLLGGSLDSAPTPDGGWVTRAVIPLETRTAA